MGVTARYAHVTDSELMTWSELKLVDASDTATIPAEWPISVAEKLATLGFELTSVPMMRDMMHSGSSEMWQIQEFVCSDSAGRSWRMGQEPR